jgi:hypothetical protein
VAWVYLAIPFRTSVICLSCQMRAAGLGILDPVSAPGTGQLPFAAARLERAEKGEPAPWGGPRDLVQAPSDRPTKFVGAQLRRLAAARVVGGG